MTKLKEELLLKFSNNEVTAVELVNMIVELQERIDAAIDFTDYDWDSQSSQLRVIRETLEGK